jgi:uncharacterized protein YacL
VIFVEVLRLIVVVAGALAGLAAAQQGHSSPDHRVLGAALGVLIGYVVGGGAGRLIDRSFSRASRRWKDLPPTEILAGGLLGGLGFLVGVVLCIPLFVFVRQDFDYPASAAVAWVLGYFGLRVGAAKGRQISEAARLSRRFSVAEADAPSGSTMVDTSAVMDRAFLVLGSMGLLGAEILVPEPVADELRTLADGPDPVASRRARRGLEALEAVRDAGVTLTVVAGDVPAASMTEEKVLTMAGRAGARLVTSSAEVARQHAAIGIQIIDLRSLITDLAPDHVPGENLLVDLVRTGSNPGRRSATCPTATWSW